jgi:hypothetical protein
MDKKFIISTSLGVLAGGVLGFLYWKYVGCSSGSCAITSSKFNSSLYGMLMGGLLFSTRSKKKIKNQK